MKQLVLYLMVGAALSACSGRMADLEKYVADVKNRKNTNIDPIPQIKPYEAFNYVLADRRDPFVRSEPARDDNAATTGLKPDLNRNREPLEEFPLDSLKMLGVIKNGNASYAMIKAPDNVVHRIGYGNHLGQNYGKVVKITETQIDLTEIIPDGFGGFMERPASLALAE